MLTGVVLVIRKNFAVTEVLHPPPSVRKEINKRKKIFFFKSCSVNNFLPKQDRDSTFLLCVQDGLKNTQLDLMSQFKI